MTRVETPGYLDLGFAKLDTAREGRTGFAEVIYGAGKTVPQLVAAFAALADRSATVLATRCDAAQAAAVSAALPDARWHPEARTIVLRRDPAPPTGSVVIATAGTADAPVAAEAAVTAEAFGANVGWCRDIGIAGIHRLVASAEQLRGANAIIAVAGMDGALPGAIAGLVNVPVIAVPTTYAGSEMTTMYGLTEAGAKKTGKDPRVLPRTVIYDPELSLGLPFAITVAPRMARSSTPRGLRPLRSRSLARLPRA